MSFRGSTNSLGKLGIARSLVFLKSAGDSRLSLKITELTGLLKPFSNNNIVFEQKLDQISSHLLDNILLDFRKLITVLSVSVAS